MSALSDNPPHGMQPCHLVSLTGAFLTVNGTFSSDPSQALTAERWRIERLQARVNAATIVIRAA